mgnify:CR=1 FL=1
MIRVQSNDFELGLEINKMRAGRYNIGGICSFIGLVRDIADGEEILSMTLEHYPGMTEKALTEIDKKAHTLWPLIDTLVIHRYGKLSAGDLIMMVATAAPHRRDAFEAAEYLMDYLKSRAPFWKKENTNTMQGWVDAKDEDEDALSRW